jgi:hypothetical protein
MSLKPLQPSHSGEAKGSRSGTRNDEVPPVPPRAVETESAEQVATNDHADRTDRVASLENSLLRLMSKKGVTMSDARWKKPNKSCRHFTGPRGGQGCLQMNSNVRPRRVAPYPGWSCPVFGVQFVLGTMYHWENTHVCCQSFCVASCARLCFLRGWLSVLVFACA